MVSRQAGLALLVAGAALTGLGCSGGDITPPPTNGSLTITTNTTGPESDADGYAVTIDGGTETAIPASGSLQRENVEPGNHSIRLTGMAANCTVAGENPRNVSLPAGETVTVTFQLTCGGTTGSLQISSTTTGPSPDADGYTITVDGADWGPLAASGASTLDGLPPGVHAVGLGGVAANCQVQGDNPRSITIVAGAGATTSFAVVCRAVSLIAFTSVVEFEGSFIYVVKPDGTRLTRLAAGKEPQWSPDGRKILSSHIQHPYGLYVMNADGSGEINLINDKIVQAYRWSPDGKSIAVLTELCEDQCTETTFFLWVMRADGSDQTMVSRRGGIPSWSPDGRSLVFTSRYYEFLIINADGTQFLGGARQFSGGDLSSQPAWSPDGTRIAFIDVENNGIWLINPDGSGLVKLTDEGYMPVWSPDGRKLLFSWFHPTPGTGGIGVINRDGSGRADLTNEFDSDPRWSPDGSRIVFRRALVSGGLNAGSDIFVMNADGSGQTNVSNTPGPSDHEPVWSP